MYRIGCDIGGTFTDLALIDTTTGEVTTGKVLTTPHSPAEGALHGIESVLASRGVSLGRDVEQVIHGTTLVINTIIERRGAPTALLVTEGFRDFLEVGRGARYDNYDINIEMPKPLVPRRWRRPIRERIDREGRVRIPLDENQVRSTLKELKAEGVEAVAVCFLHSFRNPVHEKRVKELAAEVTPELHVTLSCELVPEMREFERASAAVANAYTRPAMRGYLAGLCQELARRGGSEEQLLVMLSHGGLTTAAIAGEFPLRVLESGPAAGAIMASTLARELGIEHALSFDMGGTTAKSCLIENGEPSVTKEFEVARMARFKRGSGIPINLPIIEMMEIGAGGGSIATIDEMGLLAVGPQSAGAVPGPACYDRGGQLPTVTDADLLLGYLNPRYFLGGRMALSEERARRAIEEHVARPGKLSVEEAAWGIHDVVNENMANATRVLAVEKGLELTGYTLIAFGGAGPVHAYGLARKLDIERMIVPGRAGVASAFGMLVAPLSFDFIRTYIMKIDDSLDFARLNEIYGEMEAEGRRLLTSAGVPANEITITRSADMRYLLQGREIDVPVPTGRLGPEHRGALLDAFTAAHAQKFNWAHPDLEVVGVNWKVMVSGPRPKVGLEAPAIKGGSVAEALKGSRPVYFPEFKGARPCPVYSRKALGPGADIPGPAIIEEEHSTAIVGPGGRVTTDRFLNLVITVGR